MITEDQQPCSSTSSESLYAVIHNIPKDYRSRDLRRVFFKTVEDKLFKCCHFKHRPEIRKSIVDRSPKSTIDCDEGAAEETFIAESSQSTSSVSNSNQSASSVSKSNQSASSIGNSNQSASSIGSSNQSASTTSGSIQSTSSISGSIQSASNISNSNQSASTIGNFNQSASTTGNFNQSASTTGNFNQSASTTGNSNQPASSTRNSNQSASSTRNSNQSASTTCESVHSGEASATTEREGTFCAFASFFDRKSVDIFVKNYSGMRWPKSYLRCIVQPCRLSAEELSKMPEFRPPAVMPRGNVGTPNGDFLQLIQQCKLPPSVMKQLGITFSGRRKAKYGAVPPPIVLTRFDRKYSRTDRPADVQGENEEDEVSKYPRTADRPADTATDKTTTSIPYSQTPSSDRDKSVRPHSRTDSLADGSKSEDKSVRHHSRTDSPADGSESEEEEWDRHCALHDDVTSQDRTKPRLYEQTEEVVWEKGGPGLVFYTDDFYWQQTEEGEDLDETATDDWDVDMQVYEGTAELADKDARDCLEMREFAMMKDGKLEKSVFAKKVMVKHGWSEGSGLGTQGQGEVKTVAEKSDGQAPTDKSGLGYYGEKLQRYGLAKRKRHHFITTVFDDPVDTDEPETSTSRNEPTWIKHRT